MLKRIDHLGIAVRSLEESMPTWVDGMGFKFLGIEEVADQKVKVAMLSDDQEHVELLEATDPTSPIAKFIEKRGPGLHHTCFEVDDIKKTLQHLKGKGFRLIDESPRVGAGNCLIAFVHPKSTDGALIEVKEKKK